MLLRHAVRAATALRPSCRPTRSSMPPPRHEMHPWSTGATQAAMVSMPTPSRFLSSADEGLTELLGDALADLRRLQTRTEFIAITAGDARGRVRRPPIEALCSTLEQGCTEISTRMNALGHAPPATRATPRHGSTRGASPLSPHAVTKACRSCFRHLCGALREARRISDTQTAAVLIQLVLSLEKQLWLLGPPLRERGASDWRAVNLFSHC